MNIVYKNNGSTVSRDEFLSDAAGVESICESRQAPGGHRPENWSTGMESTFAGVFPNQVKEHVAEMKRDGITGVEAKKNGDVVFDSPGNRERYLKWRGLADYSAAGSGCRNGSGYNSQSCPSAEDIKRKHETRKKERDEKDRKAIRKMLEQG